MTLYKTVADLKGGTQVAMTADEETAFIAQQTADATAQITVGLKAQAQQALDASDLTATRCFKAGVSFPSEWQTYVAALRVIVNDGTGDLPTQPQYPQGT